MANSTYSANTRRAVAKYGRSACLRAYRMNAEDGEGARSIAATCDPAIATTRQADAAINAGRELVNLAAREMAREFLRS